MFKHRAQCTNVQPRLDLESKQRLISRRPSPPCQHHPPCHQQHTHHQHQHSHHYSHHQHHSHHHRHHHQHNSPYVIIIIISWYRHRKITPLLLPFMVDIFSMKTISRQAIDQILSTRNLLKRKKTDYIDIAMAMESKV